MFGDCVVFVFRFRRSSEAFEVEQEQLVLFCEWLSKFPPGMRARSQAVQAQHRIAGAPISFTMQSRFGDAIKSHCLKAMIADPARVSYAQALRKCSLEGGLSPLRFDGILATGVNLFLTTIIRTIINTRQTHD